MDTGLPYGDKREAHHALSILFHREGVPQIVVMDGSREETLGKFHQNLEMLAVKRRLQIFSPIGRILLNRILSNSRNVFVGNPVSPTCQDNYETTALSMRHLFALTLPTTSSSLKKKSLRLSCLAKLPSSVNSVSLIGMNGSSFL